MTSHNPIVLDDEAMERPPYTGIQQWAAMRQNADKGPTITSNRAPRMPQTMSALEPSSSHNPQHRKASAYLHIPVAQPPPPNPPQAATNASQAPTRWHVPPQQVCKDGATPTAVCGRYSTALNDPPVGRGGTGPYKCPRCHGGYSRIDSVRQHFPHCIALNGNPDCLSWTDDDSYAAGVASRSASRVGGRVIQNARQTPAKPAHLVTLGISELVIRIATHDNWQFDGLEPSSGELPDGNETKEEEDKAWKQIAKNLKEETRHAQEISPETEALIGSFKEEGLWDSEPSDEA